MHVATVRVQRPFPIVRFTLPLPDGEPWDPHRCPFSLLDNGVECETQWERVSRGVGADVRVAEILARVAPSTTPRTYTLVRRDGQRDAQPKPGPFARALLGRSFLCFDSDALALEWGSQNYRTGSVATTRRFSGPNFFGWITVFDGLDVGWIDLVVHNALPGSSMLGFGELSLMVDGQPDVGFTSCWPERHMAPASNGFTLVTRRGDGKLHALEQRGWRVFQGALFKRGDAAAESLAAELAAGAGWGVADTWTSVDAFQPHALRLPNLAYRAGELRSALTSEWSKIKTALANGAPYGMGATEGGELDWRHPWGPKYGGVTGGAYRAQWCGVEALATGEVAGVLELRARLRMLADRSPVAIVSSTGDPEYVENWYSSGLPNGGWSMSSADARFDANKDGAFGWSTAPAGPPMSTLAPEFQALLEWAPIDFQHCDRATKPAEALVYLTNDPIARWWVTMAAELWRMSRWSQNRLKQELANATAKPDSGCHFGRADGLGWENAAAAYAIGRNTVRSRLFTDLKRFVQTLVLAQMPSGLFRRDYNNKAAKAPPFGDGNTANWAITKGTEEALLAGALFAVVRASGVVDPTTAFTTLRAWTTSALTVLAGPSPSGFSDYVGAVPVTWSTPPGSTWPVATLGTPLGEHDTFVRSANDRTELASPLGCMMLYVKITGGAWDPRELAAARRWAGNFADPLAWMKAQTAYKLELDDCTPLHAAFELP